MYLILKHLHVTFVALSFIFFFTRGVWMITGSRLLNSKLSRIAPHVINTIMLLSGIAVAVYLQLSPGNQPWLLAKLLGLVIYIGLGVMAFKAVSPGRRTLFWVLALIVFLDLVAIAVLKTPWGILGL